MAEVIDGILIREVETKNIMTKSSLPPATVKTVAPINTAIASFG